MIKDLDDRGLTDRTCLKVLHSVLAGQSDGLNLSHGVVAGPSGRRTLVLLHVGATRGQINHVADKDLDRALTALTLVDPLLDLFETAPLRDVEHKQASSAAVYVLVDIFMVPFAPGHVEVDNLVLISIINVVSCLDMQLGRLLVLNDSAEGL